MHISGFGNFKAFNVSAKGFKMPNGSIVNKEPFKAIKFVATGKLKDKVNQNN